MSPPASTKRFRVALSFPGEHRDRVERIAEALADKLGREKVLYDKWHAAELNRPNLDVYLSKLYHDESDVIAVFLGAEYNAKEWCGLEWRACRDLLKHKEDVRLMFFRLDDAEIPGLYSIDGYQDIRAMADGEVAASILERLEDIRPERIAEQVAFPGAALSAPAPRTSIQKLPTADPNVFGRDAQLDWLEQAWANPQTNFVQIIAPGGAGKTALMTRWYRRHLADATIFGWSFYSQGTREKSQTSSDPFFAEALPWFGITLPATATIFTKVDLLVARLRRERALLILDGVEPLQDPSGGLRDVALKALLQELAARNAGLVLATTRVRLTDVPDDKPQALSLDLENLAPADGARYLAHLGVRGPEDELRAASEAYENHALALTLLGTYLVTFCDADIRRRADIRELEVPDIKPGRHARKVMASYARMYEGEPELAILRALGYFDRPAELAALKLVLPAMEDRKYRAALKRLRDARLILTTDPAQPLDCHPLVREHFAAEATREGHARLYEHYKKQAPHRPDTIEEMTPLFHAVYHGCQAGQHQEAAAEVYRDRILRGAEAYLTKKLGAFGTNLSLLANFFETPWTQPVAALSPAYQSWVISEAGFALRAVGRLADAVEPMRAGAEAAVKLEDWTNAAIYYGNLSELHLTLGNVPEAVAAARQAVDFADRSGEWFQRVASRTALADALHQSGDLAEAMRLFAEAERLPAGRQREYTLLC